MAMFKIGPLVVALALTLASAWPDLAAAAPKAAHPQPSAQELRDGLAVEYYFAKFNHVRELETWMKYRDGKPGAPLSALDFAGGAGDVLTSGSDDLVGARITGYIKFERPGPYRFQVTSNDGVRVSLGGEKIYEDPNVHPDRTSNPIPVTIEQAGLYRLEVLYFEKKNTSTLQVSWSPPGSNGFVFLPATVLKHD